MLIHLAIIIGVETTLKSKVPL